MSDNLYDQAEQAGRDDLMQQGGWWPTPRQEELDEYRSEILWEE